MKKHISHLLLITLLILTSKGLTAQQTEWCATDEMLQEYFNEKSIC